eukprot:Gb_16043 [translate_table: standard]
MLKKIHTKARPRIFKPSVTKSRWKSNVCVALAGFLLLLSVSLLHTKLGAEGTDSKKKDNSVEVSKFSKFSGARKELINRGDFGKERVERNGKDGVLDNSEHVTLRSGDDDLGKANGSFRAGNGEERRENLEINEKEESDEEEDAKDRDEDGDYDLGNNEMEDFDGFDEDPEDKIDEMDEVDEKEDDDEGVRSQRQDKGSEDIDTEKSSSNRRTGHEKDSIRKEGEENVPLSEDLSRGRKNWNGKQDNSEDSKVREKSIEKLREIDEGKINSEKRLERLGLIQTIPRRNSSEEQKKIEKSPYLIPIQTKTAAGEISRKGRAGLFWDHVVGVTRKAFLKHPQRQGSSRLKQRDFSNAETEQGFDIRTEGEWEDTFVDESVTGNNDRSKEAFSSDDEPIDEGIRNLLEEVTGIEDALLLKGSERSSSLRSGWGPWFDSIQRRASKSDFMRRDRMARSTVDLLNPLNNPLLQDPDAIGPAGLTKSDKAILKALKKSSIEGIPFVGEQLSHSKELPEKTLVEETDIQSKGQVQDAVALQKTLEENNLDGGDEASVKERNNSDNDDDASLKTELTQLTRKALDENDSNRTNLQRIRGNNIRRNFPKATRGIGQTRSRRSAQVERKELSHKKGLRENTRLLGENFEGEKQEAHKIISRRNILPLQKKGSGIEEDTTRRLHSLSALELQESKHQPSLGSRSFSADGTLAANVNSSGPSDKIVNNGGLLSSDNRASSNEHLDADEDIMVMSNKNTDAGDFITHKGDKTLGTMENKKIQRQGESKRLKSVTRNKVQKKHRHNGDTRRWGYFPGLDPHLSFSEFMDEFLGHGNCSLRVFMAWTTPPWSYTVRYQRGLESLLYFHPGACVVVFSDSIELDFFNDFVRDGGLGLVDVFTYQFLSVEPLICICSICPNTKLDIKRSVCKSNSRVIHWSPGPARSQPFVDAMRALPINSQLEGLCYSFKGSYS